MAHVDTVDCQYLRPRYSAAFLLVEGRESAFVEANTAHAVPHLLDALAHRGLGPESVRYLIVTHAHLDHAGGAWKLLERCPNAVLIAHPRTARHMVDPSKLVQSAKEVYGELRFASLYGDLRPIARERIRSVEDNEELTFGNRRLRFLHTEGHANHHICVESWSGGGEHGIFTGDSFGLAYPDLQGKGLFIFPSTSPTGFDPELAIQTVRRIAATGATRAYLTHYGALENPAAAAGQLLEHLEFSRSLFREAVERIAGGGRAGVFCEEKLFAHYRSLLARLGLDAEEEAWDILENDLRLNAAGICFSAEREAKRRGEGGGSR